MLHIRGLRTGCGGSADCDERIANRLAGWMPVGKSSSASISQKVRLESRGLAELQFERSIAAEITNNRKQNGWIAILTKPRPSRTLLFLKPAAQATLHRIGGSLEHPIAPATALATSS